MMKKYTLLDFRTLRTIGDKCIGAASIAVDTEADLPTPEDTWTRGTMAFVVNTSEVFMLNGEGEWKKWQ